MKSELEKQISEWLLDRFECAEGCNPLDLETSLKRIIDELKEDLWDHWQRNLIHEGLTKWLGKKI